MITLIRTNSKNPFFIQLVEKLDKELAERDGEDHAFYNQFNSIDELKHVVLAMNNGVVAGCGAIKPIKDDSVEVKRMYTSKDSRKKGVAGKVLRELEKWAFELDYRSCILETGKRQPEAIQLYRSKGYVQIENYGPYKDVENSLCFEKRLFS